MRQRELEGTALARDHAPTDTHRPVTVRVARPVAVEDAQTKLVQVVLADHLARPISPLKDRHVESIGSS